MSTFKKPLFIISFLASIKLIIQLLGNRNYGFHRDELLHLSVSEHLDWGFMEFPPLIGLIGKASYLLFDYNLMGVRLFPTLAGIAILILCCRMALELGGQWRSVLLSGICVLGFLPFYRNHTLFQPVAFDQLFWTLGFYMLIRFMKTEHHKYLLYLGTTLGVGLLNKYTMIIWAFGSFVGLIFYKRGVLFKSKWLYISASFAALIFLPNIIWQLENGWPLLGHLARLDEAQLQDIAWSEFGIAQLAYPMTLAVSIIGTFFLLKNDQYRSVGITAVVIFFTMWILRSKAYYVFALYPVLFAAGSVKLESILASKHPLWTALSIIPILLFSIPFIPDATPILPIEQYQSYAKIEETDGRISMTSDYADMFGWEEQVALVDSVYRALDPDERGHCVIWAENYGEAGALKILGKKYGLPDPISRHGSFWLWGYQDANAKVWISLGNEAGSVNHVFEEVTLIKTIYHKYAVDEENGIPLYLCRKPKLDIDQWWTDFRPYIFD